MLVGDLSGTGAGVALITGTRAQPELAGMIPTIVDAQLDAGLPTVVGDVHIVAPEAPGRGEAVTDSLLPAVAQSIVLVDDVDLTQGPVTVVLGLDVAADGVSGHFGYGEGADGVLPSWTPT